jgi:hypothetical protein
MASCGLQHQTVRQGQLRINCHGTRPACCLPHLSSLTTAAMGFSCAEIAPARIVLRSVALISWQSCCKQLGLQPVACAAASSARNRDISASCTIICLFSLVSLISRCDCSFASSVARCSNARATLARAAASGGAVASSFTRDSAILNSLRNSSVVCKLHAAIVRRVLVRRSRSGAQAGDPQGLPQKLQSTSRKQ